MATSIILESVSAPAVMGLGFRVQNVGFDDCVSTAIEKDALSRFFSNLAVVYLGLNSFW